MVVRLHVQDSRSPRPHYERFRFDGVRFYRCRFPQHSWQTYYYPAAIDYAQLPSCHINVSGTMYESSGVWPEQGPGWLSREEAFTIPAGAWTRVASSGEVVRWCCLGRWDGDHTAGYMETVRADGALQLAQGESFLLAGGRLEGVGESVRRLRARSGPVELRTVEPVLGFKWRRPGVGQSS